MPNVPLVFGLRNALFLEPPSKFQREFVKSSEEKRLHMTQMEYKALEKRTTSISANVDTGDSSDEEGLGCHSAGLQPHNTRNYSGKERDVKDRVRFKRKKAKVRSFLVSIFLLVPNWSCLNISNLIWLLYAGVLQFMHFSMLEFYNLFAFLYAERKFYKLLLQMLPSIHD